MTLQFENFKKKFKKKNFLELNFILNTKDSLAIIDENLDTLNVLKKVFLKKTKYEGAVKIFNKDIKNIDYYPFFDNNIGFYNDFSIYKNFKLLLSLCNIKIIKEELIYYLDLLDLNLKDKYSKLTDEAKLNLKILFSYLVSKNLVIIDSINILLKEENKIFIKKLIDLSKEEQKNFVMLAKDLNIISNTCDKALIISDNKQVYYDFITKLNVVRKLIIIEISNFVVEVLYKELSIDFKLIDNKLIIRKSDMEDTLYYLVSNNIDVISIDDFNDNIKLYSDKE